MKLLLAFVLLASTTLAAAQQLKPWNGVATPPPLALEDLEGRTHRLEDYRGQVVLVNFWATWCEPCREEMPSINRLRAALAGRPFAVLAVNMGESEARIRRFQQLVPLDFPVLLDRDNVAAKAWRARLLPASYVIGPEGRIRYAVLGELDWSQEAVRRALLELMPREAIPPRAALSAASR